MPRCSLFAAFAGCRTNITTAAAPTKLQLFASLFLVLSVVHSTAQHSTRLYASDALCTSLCTLRLFVFFCPYPSLPLSLQPLERLFCCCTAESCHKRVSQLQLGTWGFAVNSNPLSIACPRSLSLHSLLSTPVLSNPHSPLISRPNWRTVFIFITIDPSLSSPRFAIHLQFEMLMLGVLLLSVRAVLCMQCMLPWSVRLEFGGGFWRGVWGRLGSSCVIQAESASCSPSVTTRSGLLL